MQLRRLAFLQTTDGVDLKKKDPNPKYYLVLGLETFQNAQWECYPSMSILSFMTIMANINPLAAKLH